jgi:hypothetical protein
MKRLWAQIRTRFVSIPEGEVLVATRGFEVKDPSKVERLETIGRAFVDGYNAALASSDPGELRGALERAPPSLQGFAYEGASMGFAVADFMTPFSRRWTEFLDTIGAPHVYMIHVGYGWAMARLPIPIGRALGRLEDPLRWLAMDGYGFHQGYFQWRRFVANGEKPAKLDGYAARVFDQGLGRSLWFVCGAAPRRIATAIAQLDAHRASDLWAGVGLAATYAGGASRSELEELQSRADRLLPHVAQGAAFAAEARRRANNPTEETELACRVLCGVSFEDAAKVARETFPSERPASASQESYEVWRTRIRDHFSDATVGAME